MNITGQPNKNKIQLGMPRGVSFSHSRSRGVEHARLNICWHDTERPRKFTLHLGPDESVTEKEILRARDAAAAFRAEFERCDSMGVRMRTKPWECGRWRKGKWPKFKPLRRAV